MSRKTRTYLILGISALAFILIAFLIPFRRNEIFWIGFCAEIIAFALQIPLFRVAFEGTETLRSKVLGVPVARVGYLYLIAQTVLTFALFDLAFVPIPSWAAAVLCMILLAATLVSSISTTIARDTVEELEAGAAAETGFMYALRTSFAQLAAAASDPGVRKELEALAKSIRFSDPVSSPAIASENEQLSTAFEKLSEAVRNNSGDVTELCKGVRTALDNRNTACKQHK